MSPLDLTATPFLTLYVTLALLAVSAAAALRYFIGLRHSTYPALTPLQLAYLAGGSERVADTLLTGMLVSRTATVGENGRSIDIVGDLDVISPEDGPMATKPVSGTLTRAKFKRSIRAGIRRIRTKLEKLGLSPTPAQIAVYRLEVLALFAVPVILGIEKVQVGIERHRPVGILETLLIVTGFIGILLLSIPLVTRAGRKALRAQKSKHERAARAPLPEEFTLAVALTGLVVLSGTIHHDLYAASLSNGGGGGDGGGGGCGGGGGGCGGCGGG